MIAVINVDANPFLTFSDLICHHEHPRFWLCCAALCRLVVRKLNLALVTKRLLLEQVKIPG